MDPNKIKYSNGNKIIASQVFSRGLQQKDLKRATDTHTLASREGISQIWEEPVDQIANNKF